MYRVFKLSHRAEWDVRATGA